MSKYPSLSDVVGSPGSFLTHILLPPYTPWAPKGPRSGWPRREEEDMRHEGSAG